MTENERILKNINGELPQGQKTVLSIANIGNPKEMLEVCKAAMISVLGNPDIDYDSKDWENILPAKFVSFSKALSSRDLDGDDFVLSIHQWVNRMRHPSLKTWEWYSSELTSRGFKIIATNSAFTPLIALIHMQGVPLKDIYIEDDRFGNYTPIAIKDVTLKE